MKVRVVNGEIEVSGNELMPPLAVVGLIGELSAALQELWPEPEPGWQRDPNREDLSGRIGKKTANERTIRK